MSTAVFTTPQEAEDAFYEAFSRADLEAMMAVWSEDEEVICIHPGAPRVVGLAAVRDSWRQLFAGGTRLQITVSNEVISAGTLMAIHCVLEHIQVEGDNELHAPIVATNVFMRGALGWRMVAHHASPTPEIDVMGDSGGPLIVH
ncbi:nuclear transport factor 2 family protein [Nitrogeniibacter mangrovi]|uniref:Nuclear transport factor 2 family protein n=1 Tax=Nitrogeniibacter mangrovi TaxID=2016596 RepID=A0A6C1B3U3_9RHOO|nr:nuclear transport factor 2 family protein [Nitrogeniibacter mangrovi]